MDLFSVGRCAQPSEGKSNSPRPEPPRPDLSFPVDRQDSLMLCQQLQEKDGYDDFMDENIDLTPYLNDLQDLDGDLGEELLDKQRLIESDIYTQHCGYPPQYTDLATYEHKEQEQSFDDMASAAPATPQMSGRHLSVKVEAPWEDEATAPEQSLQPTTSSPGAKEQIEVTYTPTIKPRKYSLKPEAEKKNPLYRLKREKNNDAVRKSRSKAKEQQRMKDNQIKDLQEKVGVMSHLLEEKESSIKLLEKAVREEQMQKAELVAENKRLKCELGCLKKRYYAMKC
uniref:BZIP domain-containing protein n=1 Tax=Parascaris univalens TaxID=6257 RepID=A0A915AIZ4_PARUN